MELVNRLRDNVYWVPRLTVTRLVEDAIRTALEMHATANQSPFPRRTEELKPGRPRTRRTAGREMQISQLRTIRSPTKAPIAVQSTPTDVEDSRSECQL